MNDALIEWSTLRMFRRWEQGKPDGPAPDIVLADPHAVRRPDGTVWMHPGCSRHRKPGCGEMLEQAPKFDPPVKIWRRED